MGVALGIGVLAALVTRSYLSRQMEEIAARGKTEMVEVISIARPVRQGQFLGFEDVTTRQVPVAFLNSDAITPAMSEQASTRKTAVDLKPNDVLTWSHLQTPAATFSQRIKEGHRAMTLAVDEINSISGMLAPGDVIDLLVTLDQKGKKIITPLLQGVQVMATGQRVNSDPQTGEKRSYSTVTLDTDLQEARNLIAARELGKITALLRNPGEKAPLKRGSLDLAALMAGGQTPKAANDRGIPVLYGSSKLTEEETALATPQRRAPGAMGLQAVHTESAAPVAAESASSAKPTVISAPPAKTPTAASGAASTAAPPPPSRL